MILRPPSSTRTSTLLPYMTRFRSVQAAGSCRVLRGEPRKGGDDILQRHVIGELADDDVLQPHRARIGAQPRTARLPEPRDQLPGVARGFVARALQPQRAIGIDQPDVEAAVGLAASARE